MKREFHTYDVFTETRFAGNPLAIVTDGTGLDTSDMQAIAREFNLSETVFLLPPENSGHTAKMRIFTPGSELPFAGHPTVGTAVYLAQREGGSGTESVIITLELTVGPVQIEVKARDGKPPHAVFDIPKQSEEVGEAQPVEAIAAALGLSVDDIGFDNHVPSVFSAGNPFGFVPVKSLDAMARAQVVAQNWDKAFVPDSHPAAFVYSRECVNADSAFHARMFWPAIGVMEDPATGSAVAALTGVINRFDKPEDGVFRGVIEQGFEMGRASLMSLEMEISGGEVTRASIGGTAVPVLSGTLEA